MAVHRQQQCFKEWNFHFSNTHRHKPSTFVPFLNYSSINLQQRSHFDKWQKHSSVANFARIILIFASMQDSCLICLYITQEHYVHMIQVFNELVTLISCELRQEWNFLYMRVKGVLENYFAFGVNSSKSVDFHLTIT